MKQLKNMIEQVYRLRLRVISHMLAVNVIKEDVGLKSKEANCIKFYK